MQLFKLATFGHFDIKVLIFAPLELISSYVAKYVKEEKNPTILIKYHGNLPYVTMNVYNVRQIFNALFLSWLCECSIRIVYFVNS